MGLLASATAQSVSQELIASRLRERVGLRVRSCAQSRVWHEAAANRRPIVGSTLVYAQPQCRVFCPKFKTLGGHRRADPATRMGEGGRAGARGPGRGRCRRGRGRRGRKVQAQDRQSCRRSLAEARGSSGRTPGRRRLRGRRRGLAFAASALGARHARTRPTLAEAPALWGNPGTPKLSS